MNHSADNIIYLNGLYWEDKVEEIEKESEEKKLNVKQLKERTCGDGIRVRWKSPAAAGEQPSPLDCQSRRGSASTNRQCKVGTS